MLYQVQKLALFILLISSASLFAQHYQGRDHTVFHRPPPPAPVAHHSSLAAGSSASPHGPVTTAQNSEPSRRHNAGFGTSSDTEVHSSAKPHSLSFPK